MAEAEKYPQIKFFKAAVPEILAGRKTMEARPRSLRWIDGIERARIVELTWGARFAPPTIFARAQIERVDIKPFAEATEEDIKRFANGWQNRSVAAFDKNPVIKDYDDASTIW